VATTLVTGGTGTLGREVVSRLLDAGGEVTMASRRPRPAEPTPYRWASVDYADGATLDAAVRGADAIVHCAGAFRDVDVDRTLIEAARRAGTPHLVYISIVGVDRVPFSYYRTKLAAERLVEDSGLPWTILRATQFHDLIAGVSATLARSPVVPVPAGVSFQPVDVREVAARLAELATGVPAGRVPDLGGPQVRAGRDLVRAYLRHRGLRRLTLPVRLPGKAFRGYRQGGHLAPDRAVGQVTFEQFLTERITKVRR
jgi:uncharacterized protein YbjT (DUF2867 family)